MKSLMPDEEILELLKTVDDPELTNVSVYDLGMVYSVSITGSRVSVTMVPTFAGCPALDFIERDDLEPRDRRARRFAKRSAGPRGGAQGRCAGGGETAPGWRRPDGA